MKVRGGKALYGASVGVLMLEARFPRAPGDMGNALSFDFPVLYRVVRGASPERVVRRRAAGLFDAFAEAARGLLADGADGIVTNCGFLSLMQRQLAAAVDAPVATSSLMQVAAVERLLPPGRRAGVLTISAETLTPEHLAAAGAPADAPVQGTEAGREFSRVILEDEPEMDLDAARADNVEAARALQAREPGLGAIVLECTNMTPFAADIRAATGLPVFSMLSFTAWFQSGLAPRRWR